MGVRLPYLANEDIYRLVLWVSDDLEHWEQCLRPEGMGPADSRIIGFYARTEEDSGPWVALVRTLEGPLLLCPEGKFDLSDDEVLVENEDLGDNRLFRLAVKGTEVVRLQYAKRPYGWDWFCADETDTDLFLRIACEYRTQRFQEVFST
ncbi:MAG: hypothetical protein HN348_06895 [Proteobacteria bacterium]|nr:hypothetical protein [Pseudomonadota bacterium]